MGRIPSRGSDQFMVRFPDGMRDKIRQAADSNGRSMNAEIIARLEASFESMAIPVDQVNRIVDKTIDALIRHGWSKKP